MRRRQERRYGAAFEMTLYDGMEMVRPGKVVKELRQSNGGSPFIVVVKIAAPPQEPQVVFKSKSENIWGLFPPSFNSIISNAKMPVISFRDGSWFRYSKQSSQGSQ